MLSNFHYASFTHLATDLKNCFEDCSENKLKISYLQSRKETAL